jgi:LytS/YehU family sensor histidine kinase
MVLEISGLMLCAFWVIEFKVFDVDLWNLRPPFDPNFPPMPPRPQPDFLLPLVSAYFASFLVKLYPLFIDQQFAQVNLQNQKQEIQISLLKAQMEPHFLFNTLNNLRYLLRAAPEKADNAIIQLSDLLRYTVYTSEVDKVTLQEEVNYINNYIELQKIRLPADVTVETKFNINTIDKQLPPLLLIPFIENAFKYGVSAQYPGFIIIELIASEKEFMLKVNNRNYRHNVPESTGIGISNVRKRLAYYYPEKHILDIQNTDNYYTINLKIQW